MKNYYIQGNKDKADQIKAAFEKLGYDVTGFDMCNDNILFFTYKLQTGGKVLSTTNANLYTADIIKTHPDYKELELPVQPKFKVVDKVIYGGKERTITFMDDEFYDFDGGCAGCRIEKQDELLSPASKPHYDIKNLNPFDKVLSRDYCCEIWVASLFSNYDKDNIPHHFVCIDACYAQCIPFNDDTKHLLGTADPCDEQYINW